MLSSRHVNTPESGFPADRRTRRRAETAARQSVITGDVQYSPSVSQPHATFELNNKNIMDSGRR